MTSPINSAPSSPRKSFFSLGLGSKGISSSGTTTPGGHITNIAQTPILEFNNPLEKVNIPSEAREQYIVGLTGEKLDDEIAKVLIALDGTEAGDRSFQYLLENKVLRPDSHIFPNIISTPWVAGPLTIDTKKQNELLKQIRFQAIEKLEPYKAALKKKGYKVTIHVLHGDARASLLRVANFHNVDLVVVGKRNKNWKKGLTSGTVSSYLVSHCTSPVLIIK